MGLPLELMVNDAEVISELKQFEEGEPRDQFVLRALKVGVLALKQARGELDAKTIRHEGKQLMATLRLSGTNLKVCGDNVLGADDS